MDPYMSPPPKAEEKKKKVCLAHGKQALVGIKGGDMCDPCRNRHHDALCTGCKVYRSPEEFHAHDDLCTACLKVPPFCRLSLSVHPLSRRNTSRSSAPTAPAASKASSALS